MICGLFTYDSVGPSSAESKLLHELWEQYQKQVRNNYDYFSAHDEALRAERKYHGWEDITPRGKPNAIRQDDGSFIFTRRWKKGDQIVEEKVYADKDHNVKKIEIINVQK